MKNELLDKIIFFLIIEINNRNKKIKNILNKKINNLITKLLKNLEIQ